MAGTLGHNTAARECSRPLRGQKAETTSKHTVSIPTVRFSAHLSSGEGPAPSSGISLPPPPLPPSASILPPPFTYPPACLPGSGLALSPSPGSFWLCPQVSSPISSDLSDVCLFVLKAISFLERNSAIEIVNYLH